MTKAALPSVLVAMVLLAVGVKAEAQQPKKVPRIGYLSNTDPARESTRFEGIRLAGSTRSNLTVPMPCGKGFNRGDALVEARKPFYKTTPSYRQSL